MAKCDEGYRCEVCGRDVQGIRESDLYLRYVVGLIEPETLHTTPERHIRCNPALAQFICDPKFEPATLEGDFAKENLDRQFVAARETLLTRGWQRLQELAGVDLPIIDYPLPEVREQLARRRADG